MNTETVIIAIDFDGTICEAEYPNIGAERKHAKDIINRLFKEGYGVVINTCRAGVPADFAQSFLDSRGINYHAFNENLPHLIEEYGNDCRKISADVYIDDRCLFELPEWDEIYKVIKDKFPNPVKN